MIKEFVKKIIAGKYLSEEEAYAFIASLAEGSVSDVHATAIMVGIQQRGLQLDELKGFRRSILKQAVLLSLDGSKAIDLCGTGGDGKNTFNISTLSSFILASLGYKVIKHGNYGLSSICGSSNVLENLGFQFTNDQTTLAQQFEETNLCFLHAPLFHPCLKAVATARKELGVPSFFNYLGPLCNPVQPGFQLTGTNSLLLAKMYQQILMTERENFTVLHGMDGFDELSFIGTTRILGKSQDNIIQNAPNDYFPIIEELDGGTSVEEASAVFLKIIQGKGNVAQNTVLAGNVALGIRLYDKEKTFPEAFDQAYEAIASAKALPIFKALIQ